MASRSNRFLLAVVLAAPILAGAAWSDESSSPPVVVEDPAEAERRRGTLDDMKRLGRALQSWTVDQAGSVAKDERLRLTEEGRSASKAAGPMPVGIYLWREGPMRPVSGNELSRMLRPTTDVFYIRNLPRKDRWGNRFEVLGSPKNVFSRELFAIRSAGPNGRFEGPRYPIGAWESGAADDDIVWADGALLRWPAGHGSEP
jgi:hypothetical protein